MLSSKRIKIACTICVAVFGMLCLLALVGCSEESTKANPDDSVEKNEQGEPLFTYDGFAGGSPDTVLIHATGVISSIDSDDEVIAVSDFESAIQEKTGLSTISISCSGPMSIADGMSIEQLAVGQRIVVDFGWPQDGEALVASVYPK